MNIDIINYIKKYEVKIIYFSYLLKIELNFSISKKYLLLF